ncbi:MAG: GNAT family N-acetyltransferase [Cyanobacteria bacterium SID2]|nr:GNAT family N-acetyltransferase [Cyanobacteria bacterium SID2]MBP0005430.1 GNAT family N-acetyltransferase [Cyanobacteria bacterium SBC]
MSDEISQPNPQILIREMGIDDIAPIFHLGEKLFSNDLYPTLYRTWDEWEVTGAYNTDSDLCLVGEVESQFAGFILGTVVEKKSNVYSYIRWLGVKPDFHRLGIAGKLVDRFIERTIGQGADTVLMDTDPSNEAAIKFFTSKGFGNPRQHVYLSLNLSEHEYYGKLLDYERDRAERIAGMLRRYRQ